MVRPFLNHTTSKSSSNPSSNANPSSSQNQNHGNNNPTAESVRLNNDRIVGAPLAAAAAAAAVAENLTISLSSSLQQSSVEKKDCALPKEADKKEPPPTLTAPLQTPIQQLQSRPSIQNPQQPLENTTTSSTLPSAILPKPDAPQQQQQQQLLASPFPQPMDKLKKASPTPTIPTATNPAKRKPEKQPFLPSTASSKPSTSPKPIPPKRPTNISDFRKPLTLPNPIADATVVKAVQDILAMLQTYGPLTHDQLEYNLPPMGNSSKLQQILDILVVTGILRIIDDSSSDTTNTQQNVESPPQPPKYAFLSGTPRVDTLTPHNLLQELQKAQKEISESQSRIELLKQELKKNSTESKPTKEILQKMLWKYPQLASDPVYSMAFQNCKVVEQQERLKKKKK